MDDPREATTGGRSGTDREELVSEVSHALKGPLHTILGTVDLLLSGTYGPVDPDHRDRLERLIRRSEDLDRRIEAAVGLLDVELGRGASPGGDGPVDARLVVEAAVRRVAPEARERGGAVEIDLAGDPPALRGRPDLLLRLFEASLRFLLLEAGPARGGLRVRARPSGDGRARFGLVREDAGSGGGPAGPGGPGDGDARRREGAASLELLLARRAAAALGGELRVEAPERPWGTGVFFDVPLFGDEDDEDAATVTPGESEPRASA